MINQARSTDINSRNDILNDEEPDGSLLREALAPQRANVGLLLCFLYSEHSGAYMHRRYSM